LIMAAQTRTTAARLKEIMREDTAADGAGGGWAHGEIMEMDGGAVARWTSGGGASGWRGLAEPGRRGGLGAEPPEDVI